MRISPPANPRHLRVAQLPAWILFLACMPLLSRGASPTLTFDLATPPAAGTYSRIHGHGAAAQGASGVPVCGGFDCDGDGFRDYGFAQIKNSPLSRSAAGEITLVFGDGTFGATVDASVFQPGILRIAGAQVQETAGAEIWMDDVTGDGLGDLIIGRQNHTPAAGRAGAGALTIIVGGAGLRTHAATLTHFDLAAPPAGIKMVTFAGVSAYDRLGIWMRTGDIDGDGTVDIVVGADETDEEGQAVTYNSGAVYIIRGGGHLATAPAVVDLADFGSTALEGNIAMIVPPPGSSDYHFGGTVQVGDLDGNGRAEVLAAATIHRSGAGLRLSGAPFGTGESQSGVANGALFISWDENFPSSAWPAGYRFDVTDPPFGDYTRIDGISGGVAPENDAFGEEILAGLDYSGDGFADLFVGDLVAETINGTNSGLGHVFYNAVSLRGKNFVMNTPPPDVLITSLYGPIAGAIGSDTSLHGDFDNDGIADLAVANPCDNPSGRSDAGTVHVFYGQPGGWPTVIDQAPGQLPAPGEMRIAEIIGANAGDTLCYSAMAGDIDADGVLDLIVNEMRGDGFGGSPQAVGNMLVIHADALLPANASSLSFSTGSLVDFGVQDINAGPTATQLVDITNVSGSAVNIVTLQLTGPEGAAFRIAADTGELILNTSETRTVQIEFDPSTTGAKGGALAVTTTTDTHRAGIGLRGIGVDAAIRPEALAFINIGSGDGVFLRIRSQIGYTYELSRGTDLSDWLPVETGIPGNGGILPLFDPVPPAGPRVFYRGLREPLGP